MYLELFLTILISNKKITNVLHGIYNESLRQCDSDLHLLFFSEVSTILKIFIT